jgi:hypothetical protein
MSVDKITRAIELGTRTVVVKALSAKKLGKARAISRAEAIATAKDTGPDLIKAFRELSKAEANDEITPEMRRAVLYQQFDRTTVLQAGIVSWSDGEVPADPEDVLLETEAQKLHTAIIDMSVPDESTVPKDSGPSTAT